MRTTHKKDYAPRSFGLASGIVQLLSAALKCSAMECEFSLRIHIAVETILLTVAHRGVNS